MRFLFLIMTFLTAFPALADDVPMDTAIQGLWSEPDCTESRAILALSRFYVLSFDTAAGHSLRPIRAWRSAAYEGEMLYTYHTGPQDSYLFKITDDGLMKFLFALVHPQQPLETVWGSVEDVMASEYSRCAKLFSGNPLLSQDEVNLPFLLDRLHMPCMPVRPDDFTENGICHAALFAVLDSNSDSKLDLAEITRLYRQAVFLAAANNASCTDDTPPWPGETTSNAASFAAQALSLLDRNGDNGLAADEIVQGLKNPFAGSVIDSLMRLLRRTRHILPFIPLSDAERLCAGPEADPNGPYTGEIFLDGPAPSPLSLTPPPEGGCGCTLSP